jgi:hypothetical protein
MQNQKTWSVRHGGLPWKSAVFAVTLVISAAGCGASLAPVTGKVTWNGEPVKGGTLIFSPVTESANAPGRPGSAEIQSDGTFVVSTERPRDGAVVGRHRITFTPPPQELTQEQRTDPTYIAPPPPYMNVQPREAEVEIKSGSNTVEIQLVPMNLRR